MYGKSSEAIGKRSIFFARTACCKKIKTAIIKKWSDMYITKQQQTCVAVKSETLPRGVGNDQKSSMKFQRRYSHVVIFLFSTGILYCIVLLLNTTTTIDSQNCIQLP